MQYYRSVSDHYPVYVEVNMGKNGGTPPSGKQNIISPLSAQVLYGLYMNYHACTVDLDNSTILGYLAIVCR